MLDTTLMTEEQLGYNPMDVAKGGKQGPKGAPELDLDVVHPDYKRVSDMRQTARDLFDGEEAVKKEADRYLIKTVAESDDPNAYDRRLRRAWYDNFVVVVVNARVALLWRRSPTREDFGALEPFLKDIDNRGTDADTFFKNVSENAAVDGMHWVLIDKSRLPFELSERLKAGGKISRAEEEAAGMRPFMSSIPAQAVMDWEIGEDKKLEWVVIKQTRLSRPGYGREYRETPQRLIWTRGRWEVYEQQELDGKKVWALIEYGDNPTGVVPIVPFYGIKIRDGLGLPVSKDIHGHCIAIYNTASDRTTAEYLTNNPIPVFIGPNKPDTFNAGYGNGMHLESAEGVEVNVFYLEPSGSGIEASRKTEDALIYRIFEIALRQAKKDTAQVESADTIKAQNMLYKSSIMSVAVMNEAAERQCWEIMSKWENAVFSGKVEYSKDFDDSTVDSAMVAAFSSMVEKNQLTKKTFLNILKSGEVIPELDVEQEASALDAEAKQREELARQNQPAPVNVMNQAR